MRAFRGGLDIVQLGHTFGFPIVHKILNLMPFLFCLNAFRVYLDCKAMV